MTNYQQSVNNFYVHIIESLSPQDYYEGTTTERSLCSSLDIAGIDYKYFSIYNEFNLKQALSPLEIFAPANFESPYSYRGGINQGISLFQKIPIIHICAHGFDDYSGISLTDKTKITWEELGSQLGDIRTQIRKSTNLNIPLGVVMSSCYGASGSSMASLLQYSQCFDWLIGSEGKIGIADAALAFAVFYRMLQKRLSVQEACNVASNIHPLRCFCGRDIRVNTGLDNFIGNMFL